MNRRNAIARKRQNELAGADPPDEEPGHPHIRQMKNRDIRTIEQSELEELPQDAVEYGLPQEERLKNLLDKVGNPYCYLDNGIIVKLNFAPRGSSTLSERIGRCFQSAS